MHGRAAKLTQQKERSLPGDKQVVSNGIRVLAKNALLDVVQNRGLEAFPDCPWREILLNAANAKPFMELGSYAPESRIGFAPCDLWGLRRSRRVAAEPTQNLRQIRAAVLQHLVDRSAAFVVLGVDVGTVFDEKLDDLLAVLRVLISTV